MNKSERLALAQLPIRVLSICRSNLCFASIPSASFLLLIYMWKSCSKAAVLLHAVLLHTQTTDTGQQPNVNGTGD
jgi:hypothetical protein